MNLEAFEADVRRGFAQTGYAPIVQEFINHQTKECCIVGAAALSHGLYADRGEEMIGGVIDEVAKLYGATRSQITELSGGFFGHEQEDQGPERTLGNRLHRELLGAPNDSDTPPPAPAVARA